MFKKLFTTTALTTATLASAAAVFMSGAGIAMAPEAGRLNSNSPLAASANAWAYGSYVNSGTATYGFYLSNYRQSGYPYQSYAGYPCSRVAQPGGATLAGYIMVSGNLSRCSAF